MPHFTRAALAACFAIQVLCGGSGGLAAAPDRDGGTMSDVVFHRLGKVVPGKRKAGPYGIGVNEIYWCPIVLWRGNALAAALYNHTRTYEERFERFDESRFGWKRGPFPLVWNSPGSLIPKILGINLMLRLMGPGYGKHFDDSDAFDSAHIVIADVNGDGVDEFILPRADGTIEVYSVKKRLFKQRGPEAPQGMRFKVEGTYTAKLKSRDVVFFWLSLHEKEGHKVSEEVRAKAPPFAILRVDQRGISRVPLPDMGVPIKDVRAVGAINRPGSADLDEILLLFDVENKDGRQRTCLSRQRPDGGLIAPPRQVDVPLGSYDLDFLFLTGTDQAIIAYVQDPHLYFIQPDKPEKWISDVNLNPLADSHYRIEILQPMDPGADPKVMVAVKDGRDSKKELDCEALYAVNSQGKYFKPDSGKNGWRPAGGREPFLRLELPSTYHRFVGVGAQPGTDVVLAVFSREAQTRDLSEKEVLEAADRFLQPKQIAENREIYREVSMNNYKNFSSRVDEERKLKGVKEEILTVEQWKRILPDSYQYVDEFKMRGYKNALEVDLKNGFTSSFDPDKYRNIEEYKAWLNGLKIGPETVFEVVRHGQIAASAKVPGYVPDAASCIPWPIDFHVGTDGACVVLFLDPTPSVELKKKQRPGFYQATFPWKTQ